MKNKLIMLFLMCTQLTISSCTNNTNSSQTQEKKQTPEQKKALLRADEFNNPIRNKYLVLTKRAIIRPIYVETEENIKAVHKGFLIYLSIKNKATMTAYKNIKLQITYFSNTGTQTGKEEIKVEKLIKPQDSLQVARKVARYNNTNYKVNLLSATAVAQ